MNDHFDLSINYNGRLVEIKVQILSRELPKIIYAVSIKDEELKKHFENVIQFIFHINSEITDDNKLVIKNFVIYDYIEPEIKNKDIYFEFAVWNSLLFYNI
jgi:predicted DNA-binding ArsR family transcriptional regulator